MAKTRRGSQLHARSAMLQDKSVHSIPSLASRDNERLETETATCMFWTLPPEIRDMIYDYVYGGDGTVKVVVRQGWEWRERFQRSLYPTRRPFPESELSDMLVSKQYLGEASLRYVDAKVFFFEDPWALHDALESGCAINRHVIRLIRSVRVSVIYREDGLEPLALLPHLSKLEICIARWSLVTPSEPPEDDEHPDLDLLKRLMVAGLRKLRGLKQVTVREVQTSTYQPLVAAPKVQSSLDRVEQGLTRTITQPRATQDAASHIQSVWELLTSEPLPSSPAPLKPPKG